MCKEVILMLINVFRLIYGLHFFSLSLSIRFRLPHSSEESSTPKSTSACTRELVTPSKLGGPCPPPSFPGSQEFFKDFIMTAANGTFNQFLKDVLISRILKLNEQDFIVIEHDARGKVTRVGC